MNLPNPDVPIGCAKCARGGKRKKMCRKESLGKTFSEVIPNRYGKKGGGKGGKGGRGGGARRRRPRMLQRKKHEVACGYRFCQEYE